ncbi:MAG: Superfamily II RNA helicase [uncultured Rubrobacteraceae bacterium]|uniref:Superfamily II RNA helicase n=1 Tax=uncultured Rubrobacteraceae bacterium TaxID=349277 RepID=A0A6J4RD16_9ACTN|nr:MAG: Superfamily II RNA helicase [uncultured Rubrobacteraceae bacterium]
MERTARRTPEVSLDDTFLRAAAGLDHEDARAGVVAAALGHLQRGFDAHYAGGADGATDDGVLVGDESYALSVETIARLDEPRFVAVAARMIRDGAGRIASGGAVTAETWTPHLAELLDVISGEGTERSLHRIEASIRELREGVA